MSIVGNLMNIIMHIDKYLDFIIQQYGTLTYIILFSIVFFETGLVVTPFLPGDSMLFAAGAIAAMGSINIFILLIVVYVAAVLGDTANYHIGKSIGSKILEKEDIKLINREHLKKAKAFYRKHGSITIVLARFIPIIRTFAPFVAGIGKMKYTKFIGYNILGGGLWVILFLGTGYLFGNLPIIKNNFSYVIAAIITISLLPGAAMIIRKRKGEKGEGEEDTLNFMIK